MTQIMTKYTTADVSKRNGKETPEIWIIIGKSVYDVTNFIDSHPGGGDVILEWAGQDATDEFEAVGHSSDAIKDLKNYKIGELVKDSTTNGTTDKIAASAASVDSTATTKKKKKFFLFC